jgi:hypothetical protein
MSGEMIAALKLIEHDRVDVKPMITEIIPLDEAQRAFDSLHTAENIAVLLKPWEMMGTYIWKFINLPPGYVIVYVVDRWDNRLA